MHSLLFIELKWHKDCDVNYDVKHSFITTHYFMKQSFVSQTNTLFWGDRTIIRQINFHKLFDTKISKWSNKQMPRPTNKSVGNKLSAHSRCARTSTLLLEQVLWLSGCFGSVVTCLLSLYLSTCLKPLDIVLHALTLNRISLPLWLQGMEII